MRITKTCPVCMSLNLDKNQAYIAPFIAHKIMDYPLGEPPFMSMATNSIFCNECGFVGSQLRFEEDELAEIYRDYRGISYAEERNKFEPGYLSINDKLGNSTEEIESRSLNLHKFIAQTIGTEWKPHDLVDYGGDRGQFIPALYNGAIKLVYDISGARPVDGVDYTLFEDNYDFIMCCHVLEHVGDIKEIVRSIYRHTNKYAYFEVPLERKDNEERCHITCFHEHINMFNTKSLKRLLEDCSFKVIDISTMEMNSVLGITTNLMVMCSK